MTLSVTSSHAPLALLVAATRGSSVRRTTHVRHEHIQTTELRDRELDDTLAISRRGDVSAAALRTLARDESRLSHMVS